MKPIHLLCLALLTHLPGWSSECYHYHFQKSDTIINRNGKLYLQYTNKDPDGITFVSQESVLITGVDTQGFQQVDDDEVSFLVKDKTAYYLIKKEKPYDADYIKAIKLLDNKAVQKTAGATLIRTGGQWQFIKPAYDNTITRIPLPQLPKDFEILYKNSRTESAAFLIREHAAIGVLQVTHEYEQKGCQYGHIPGLDALNTILYEGNYYLDDFILMDNNTVYTIDYDLNYTEQTRDFTNQGKEESFHLMQLHRNHGNDMIFEDGHRLWIYFKDGIDLQGGERARFYPAEGRFLNDSSDIIKTNEGYFTSGYNAVYAMDTVNITAVKDLTSLRYLNSGAYMDNTQRYALSEENRLKPIPWAIPVDAIYYPPINAYRAHTPALYADSKNIYLIDDATGETAKIIPHQHPVQKITKAYIFDQKIMIEEKLLDNPGGNDSLVFIGALAEPVSPCDGGRGQVQIIVKYNYFFKDNRTVYAYHSGDRQLTVLPDLNPQSINVDNYEDIQKVYRSLPGRKE